MISIFMSYKVEQTMLIREKNKTKIENLKIFKAQKTCEIVSLDRISTVETMLEELGSDIKQPEKPADRLKREDGKRQQHRKQRQTQEQQAPMGLLLGVYSGIHSSHCAHYLS